MKKLLSIILTISMLMTCGFISVSADTSDIDTNCIETLTALDIIVGDENGNLNLNSDITRAEFATIMTRILGLEGSDVKEVFDDVPVSHWANSAVSTCYNLGIVNGYNATTFGPEDKVTYEQAIKMIVAALGFEPMASQKGGYPTGYMVVANTYGITEDVNAVYNQPAARGIIFQLVYNALDVPVMEQVSYGTENIWQVLDGTKESEYKTLLTKLGVAKIEGVLIETSKNNNTLKMDEVVYKFHKDRVYGDKTWQTFIKSYVDDDSDYASANLILAPYIVDISDYIQMSSVIYLKEIARAKYEIITIIPSDDGSRVALDVNKIDEVYEDYISYYSTLSANKTIKYRIEDVDVYYNHALVSDDADFDFVDFISNVDADAEFVLVENNGNNEYDAIIIKKYEYDIIKNIDDYKNILEGKYNDVVIKDDEDVSVILSTVDGEALSFNDFATEDVIAYMYSGSSIRNYDWIEVINLGNNFVTGSIEEIDKLNNTVYIGDKEYGIYGDTFVPALGDEGIYYLTINNKIFYSDKVSSSSGNYAYVLDASFDTDSFDSAWKLKLLTKDNKVVIYNVRESFEYNDEVFSAKTEDSILEYYIAEEDEDGADLDKGAHRVITYKLDSKNQIKEICDFNATSFSDKEYNKDAQVLAVDIEDKAVVFNVSATKSENYYATDISALVDEGKYSGYYLTNADDENDCLVILEGVSLIDYAQDLAIIASVTDITLEEGTVDAKKIRYYIGEEDTLHTLIVVEDEDTTETIDCDYDDIAEGSVFMFAEGANDVATAITVIASLNEDYEYVINETAIANICDADDDNDFIIGTIDSIGTVSSGKKIVTEDGATIVVKPSTNAYTYQNRNGKTIIHVGDWRANDVDEGMGYVYIARIYNGSVKDIITNSVLQ